MDFQNSYAHFFKLPLNRYGNKLPFILTDLITQLEKNEAERVEGIFRLAGSSALIEEMSNVFDKGRVNDWSKYNNCILLACVLKAYFRSLSDVSPAVPPEFYDKVFNISDLSRKGEEEEAIKSLTEIVHQFPRCNLYCLAYLMQFLKKISDSSDVNKMTPSNLAICIAPNLVNFKPQDPQRLIQENARQNTVITLMITYSDKIFSDITITEKQFLTDENIEVMKSMMIPQEVREAILDRIHFKVNSLIPYLPQEYANQITFKNFIQKVEVIPDKQ